MRTDETSMSNWMKAKVAGLAGVLVMTGSVLVAGVPARADGNLPGVAVMRFSDRGVPADLRDAQLGTYFANSMGAALSDLRCCRLVEREQVDKVLAQLKIDASGLVNPAEAAKVGQLTGTRYLVYGDVENVEVRRHGIPNPWIKIEYAKVMVTVTCKLLEVQSGAIVAQWQRKKDTDKVRWSPDVSEQRKPLLECLAVLAQKMAPEIRDRLTTGPEPAASQATASPAAPVAAPWKIAEVDSAEGQVYLQVAGGRTAGQGALFNISRKVKEVKNDQGEVIFVKKELVCQGRVVETSTACVVLETGRMADGKWQADKALSTQVTTECLVEEAPEAAK